MSDFCNKLSIGDPIYYFDKDYETILEATVKDIYCKVTNKCFCKTHVVMLYADGEEDVVEADKLFFQDSYRKVAQHYFTMHDAEDDKLPF